MLQYQSGAVMQNKSASSPTLNSSAKEVLIFPPKTPPPHPIAEKMSRWGLFLPFSTRTQDMALLPYQTSYQHCYFLSLSATTPQTHLLPVSTSSVLLTITSACPPSLSTFSEFSCFGNSQVVRSLLSRFLQIRIGEILKCKWMARKTGAAKEKF